MGTSQVTWEDDANNRCVSLKAEFSVEGDSLELVGLTPTKVTFHCPDTGVAKRSIGVWTQTGQAYLAQQFRSSDEFDRFLDELREANLEAVRV